MCACDAEERRDMRDRQSAVAQYHSTTKRAKRRLKTVGYWGTNSLSDTLIMDNSCSERTADSLRMLRAIGAARGSERAGVQVTE